MNKKILLAVLALCLTLALCACGGTDVNDATTLQPEATESTTTTEATTTTTTAPAIPTPEDGQVLYTVKIVDANGNPVEGAYAQLCLETCVFQPTNAEGIAYFCLPEADYKVTIIGDEAAGEHHFEAGSHEITLTQSAQ